MKWKFYGARVLVGLIIVLVIVALRLFHVFHGSMLPRRHADVMVEVERGSGLDHFIAQLKEKNLIHHPKLIRKWMLIRGDETRLRAGEYAVRPGMSISDLVNQVINGKANYYKVTFIPGWTYRDVAEELKMRPPELKKMLETPHASVEGLLYPDTYFVSSKKNKKSVLQRAYKKMKKVMQAEWEGRDRSIPYKNAYQALIAASLIEKETAVDEERPLIAGVIINRLKKGMKLQIDPTVMYGLNQQYIRQPKPADLRTNTPYNTYKHHGLPPTPISLVSRESLHAALHPAKVPYIFYFADFNGGHVFSVTLDKHREAIRAKKAAIKMTDEIVKDAKESYQHLMSSMLEASPSKRKPS